MDTPLHTILQRQLKRVSEKNVTSRERTEQLLTLVSRTYAEADKARQRLEHSVAVTSDELTEMYETAQSEKEEANKANQAKSDFLATMSHEIRTPLNGVLGFTNLLMSTSLDEKQKDIVKIIQSSGQTLLVLLNDILDLSKIEAGQVTLSPVEFDIRRTVQACVDIFVAQAGDRGNVIHTYIDPRLTGNIVTDPERVTQIINNLVGNAVKFTKNGTVSVSLRPSTNLETGEENLNEIELCVADTGVGIAADKMDQIFESFTQADSTTTRQFGGTGLGLAICKELTELMGGEIFAKSEVGAGSNFYLRLPTGVDGEVFEDGPFAQSSPLRGERVALVCHDKVEQNSVYQTLHDLGCDVQIFETVKLATAAGLSGEYTASILLCTGSGDECRDMLRFLKSSNAMPGVKLISTSSIFDGEDNMQSLVDATLTVPFSHNTVIETFSQVLGFERSAVPQNGRPSIDRENMAHKHLLFVDDNSINHQLVIKILRGTQYTVDVVSSGYDAVSALMDRDYDLVLMDISMPVIDGYATTQLIRDLDSHQANLPILALTASEKSDVEKRFRAAGLNDYLLKPFDVSELLSKIDKWIALSDAQKGQQTVQSD